MGNTEQKASHFSIFEDYSTLIKIFPIALGLSVFSNGFSNVTLKALPTLLALFLIFILITLDAIIEFGRYDYKKLPKAFEMISFGYGIVLVLLTISISLFTNSYFTDTAVRYFFLCLALTSATEAIFCIFLIVYYKKGRSLSEISYDSKDARAYLFWELLFVVLYFLLAENKFNIDIVYIPWTGLCVLSAEIFVYNFLRLDD